MFEHERTGEFRSLPPRSLNTGALSFLADLNEILHVVLAAI